MTRVKTGLIAISILLGLGLGLGSAAKAAPLQSYTIRAEGQFSSLWYPGLASYDQASSQYLSSRETTFFDAGAAELATHELSAQFQSVSGSAHVSVDLQGDPVNGNASITGCSGFLSFLCSGGTQMFDLASQTVSSFTTNAAFTTLSAAGLRHGNDRDASWTSGSTSFFTTGGGETVAFSVSSLEIDVSPVPLPAGIVLLLGGLAMLGVAGARQRC